MPKNNYVIPKESSPMKYGNTPQSNAQNMNKARHEKQQAMNKKFIGGKPPSNFGKSPDAPTDKLTVPQFQTAGLSNQNSNNASANGNANLVQGKTDATYDICATQPNSPVCTSSALSIKAPGTKGGSTRTRSNRRKKTARKRIKKYSKKRSKKHSKKRSRKH